MLFPEWGPAAHYRASRQNGSRTPDATPGGSTREGCLPLNGELGMPGKQANLRAWSWHILLNTLPVLAVETARPLGCLALCRSWFSDTLDAPRQPGRRS